MIWHRLILATGVALASVTVAASAPPAADPNRGVQVFGQCAACHSLEPGQHLTGPSLANIWGRKAGTVEGFARYSNVLKKADVMWNETTLDRWLKDPQAFIPKNLMTFAGIKDGRERADLVAYLKAVGTSGQLATAGRDDGPAACGREDAEPQPGGARDPLLRGRVLCHDRSRRDAPVLGV